MVAQAGRAEVLRQTDVFARLTREECQKLAPVFKHRSLENEEVICRQGETGDFLAVVADGQLVCEIADAEGNTTVVSRCGRGGAVGEMACLDPSPRSATVSADGITQVLVLSREMLDSMREKTPGLFARVVQGIAYRLAGMLDETNELISDLLDVTDPEVGEGEAEAKLQGGASRGRSVDPVKQGLSLKPDGALEGLSDEELEVLRSATEARRYGPDEVICMEGEPAPEAYFLVEGDIEVLRRIEGRNYRMTTISDGGFLGQRALLKEGRRSATLRAGSEGATIFGLSRDRFQALLEAESGLAMRFQEAVTVAGIRQLRQANEMAAFLGARRQKRRIPGPTSNEIDEWPEPDSSVKERARQALGATDEEDEEIQSLASAYLETSLEDWDITPSEIDRVEVVGVEDDEEK